MTWNDSYSVKVRAIDDQHKQLFDLVNQLHDAMRAGQARGFLAQALERLIRYTRTHFSDEEDAMAQVDYPDYLAHVAEHRNFTQRVETFSREFKAGTVGLSVEVMEFLQKWLVDHIMKVDQKYAPILRKG
ncbi:MAG: bacteriohemerythrin [Terriglobales bacterium]